VIVLSGVFYDADDAPGLLRDTAQVLPLTHLIDGLSGAIVHNEGLADHATALLVLAAWGAVGALLAVRGFSWEARRS
jgi:ABC-2 type transport system permease protein